MPPWLLELLKSATPVDPRMVPQRGGMAQASTAVSRAPAKTLQDTSREMIASPYVQDTAMTALSRPTAVTTSTFLGFLQGLTGRSPAGSAFPLTHSINISQQPATEYVTTHELAHIADYKNKYPELERLVKSKRTEGPGYARTNKDEYFAEVMNNAIFALRVTKEDFSNGALILDLLEHVRTADEDLPGTSDAVFTLLGNEPFKEHPLSNPDIRALFDTRESHDSGRSVHTPRRTNASQREEDEGTKVGVRVREGQKSVLRTGAKE